MKKNKIDNIINKAAVKITHIHIENFVFYMYYFNVRKTNLVIEKNSVFIFPYYFLSAVISKKNPLYRGF